MIMIKVLVELLERVEVIGDSLQWRAILFRVCPWVTITVVEPEITEDGSQLRLLDTILNSHSQTNEDPEIHIPKLEDTSNHPDLRLVPEFLHDGVKARLARPI